MAAKAKRRKDPNRGVRPGDRKRVGHGPGRVMAVADGWVMWRRPGCMPGLMTAAEWAGLADEPAR